MYDSFPIRYFSAYTELTFCELHTPCKNGGTCLDKGDDKYVCVCPKCECSDTEPFDNCTLGRYILQAVLSCCHATISGRVLPYLIVGIINNVSCTYVCETTFPLVFRVPS